MPADNFAACLAVTLGYEGGKADNPADPGGRTDKGVTQRTYDGYRRGKGEPTRTVYDISDVEVGDVYRTLYWAKAGCDALPAGLDLSHFDATVNSGLGNSAKWLAKARMATGEAAKIRAYATARLSFLEALRGWTTFGRGWSTRVAGVEAKALKMTLGSAAAPIVAEAAAGHAKACVTAATVSTAAKAAAGAAVAAAATTAHPVAAAALGTSSVVAATLSGFIAWRHRLRAAALAHAA